MGTTEPIRNPNDIKAIVHYYLKRDELRNCCLISFGLHSALRISDMLNLTWGDVFDFERQQFRDRIYLMERKTKKPRIIALNQRTVKVFRLYKDSLKSIAPDIYIFRSQKGHNRPISREQAYRITKRDSQAVGLEGNISCHSLRKTFGYRAWKLGVQPAVIMEIYNHSSFEITKRYLCIDQDDKDEVYRNMSFY
jgi:integrase